jgi:deazaflavin-dependent oxidoreductase (nitroreductase family)
MSDQSPTAEQMKAFNQQIIDEFHANDGVLGDMFAGQTGVLLTHTGAKSGTRRTNPLVSNETNDGDVYIIASANGSPNHPAWYHNLVANPTVTVEVGTEKYEATARTAEEPQRTELYQAMVDRMPQFAGYQEGNPRTIPVVILERT